MGGEKYEQRPGEIAYQYHKNEFGEGGQDNEVSSAQRISEVGDRVKRGSLVFVPSTGKYEEREVIDKIERD